MTQQRFQPIETPVGIIYGRDALFLDLCDYKFHQATLTLVGSVTASLASKYRNRIPPIPKFEIPYSLTFTSILALKIVELDSWSFDSSSSFDEVVDSDWIKQLGGKVTPEYKHYLVQTYDDVFEVVCRRYHLKMEVD